MTADRKAILAHLQIAPLYLGWGHRVEAHHAAFSLVVIDEAGPVTIVESGTLDDCLRVAGERGAL